MSHRKTLIVIITLLMALSQGTVLLAGTFAITGGTIVPVSSEVIPGGTLVIDGERIIAIGKEVAIPADAEVIDASGLTVIPGMIDAFGSLGLYEVGSVPATVDAEEMGAYNPHIKAAVAINPHSVHIPISRVNGVTSQLVAPGGGVISGQCAFINLKGWTQEEMIVKAPAAMRLNFPAMPRKDDSRRRRRSQPEASKERTEKQIQELREVFDRARRYAAVWQKYEASGVGMAPDRDLMLEALVPVIKKEIPLIVSVNWEEDIRNAVAFVDSMDVWAVFHGVNDGWKVASLLAEKDIPVIVGPVLRSPGAKDPYDARYANAGVLNKAGVKIAFYIGYAADVRSLPYHAGTAAAFGLPKEEAFKAVTLYPAEMLGLADQVGSLEVGKLANVVVTDGDPLEMRTQVKHLFIAGQKIALTSKHKELYEKFRERPKPEN